MVAETREPVRTELFDRHLGKYLEVFAAPVIDEKGEAGHQPWQTVIEHHKQ